MLRDLFFSVWYATGEGWMILIITLFCLSVASLVYIIARTKALSKNFTKKHFVSFVVLFFLIYQIIPVVVDFYARAQSVNNKPKAICFEKLAIKTALIPWQKGGYYINLGYYYHMAGQFEKADKSFKKAYEYIKSYKYWCWATVDGIFYNYGDYDTAIEIAKNCLAYQNPFKGLIAQCYIMKGDFENALIYINIKLANQKTLTSLALKAYILKKLGKKEEAKIFYKEALTLSHSEREIKRVNDYYNDFVGYQIKQQQELEKSLRNSSQEQ